LPWDNCFKKDIIRSGGIEHATVLDTAEKIVARQNWYRAVRGPTHLQIYQYG